MRLNRRCIGFEISREYVELANARLSQIAEDEWSAAGQLEFPAAAAAPTRQDDGNGAELAIPDVEPRVGQRDRHGDAGSLIAASSSAISAIAK